jgi:hypothetical protein
MEPIRARSDGSVTTWNTNQLPVGLNVTFIVWWGPGRTSKSRGDGVFMIANPRKTDQAEIGASFANF